MAFSIDALLAKDSHRKDLRTDNNFNEKPDLVTSQRKSSTSRSPTRSDADSFYGSPSTSPRGAQPSTSPEVRDRDVSPACTPPAGPAHLTPAMLGSPPRPLGLPAAAFLPPRPGLLGPGFSPPHFQPSPALLAAYTAHHANPGVCACIK